MKSRYFSSILQQVHEKSILCKNHDNRYKNPAQPYFKDLLIQQFSDSYFHIPSYIYNTSLCCSTLIPPLKQVSLYNVLYWQSQYIRPTDHITVRQTARVRGLPYEHQLRRTTNREQIGSHQLSYPAKHSFSQSTHARTA